MFLIRIRIKIKWILGMDPIWDCLQIWEDNLFGDIKDLHKFLLTGYNKIFLCIQPSRNLLFIIKFGQRKRKNG